LNEKSAGTMVKKCRFGNKVGVNMGMSVVRIKTTIHTPSLFARKFPVLVKKAQHCLARIVDSSFSKFAWYQKHKKEAADILVKVRGQDAKDKIMFEGLPVTAIWLNVTPTFENGKIHIDDNVFRCGFVLTTKTYTDIDLQYTPTGTGGPKREKIVAGDIVGGSWPLYEHNVIAVSDPALAIQHRVSWVLYFDKRVLTKQKYKLKIH
jgi:hypothetical protein